MPQKDKHFRPVSINMCIPKKKYAYIAGPICVTVLLLITVEWMNEFKENSQAADGYHRKLNYFNIPVPEENIRQNANEQLTQLIANDAKLEGYGTDANIVNTWQNVSRDGNMFVYSAYYGHVPQTNDKYVVRVLGQYADPCVRPYSCPQRSDIICVFWRQSEVVKAVMATDFIINPDHHWTRYKPVIVTCPLLEKEYPHAVSLVSVKQSELPPLNHVIISYNSLRSKPTRNFTVCLSPLYGEQSPGDLVQYFELNILLGAEYFYVYNFNTSNPGFVLMVDRYMKKGLVELIDWALPSAMLGDHAVWFFAQLTMLNDCIYRNRGISRFVITTDLDEFLVPRVASTWHDFLSPFPRACEYQVRSVIMTDVNATFLRSTNDNQIKEKTYFDLSTLKYRMRKDFVFPYEERTKYIVRPECIQIAGVHHSFSIKKADNAILDRVFVPLNMCLVNHYVNGNRQLAKLGKSIKDQSINPFEERLWLRARTALNAFNSSSQYRDPGIDVRGGVT